MTDPEESDNRRLTLSEIMPPHAANFSGHVHGGHLMLLLDRVAYACAARYAGQYAVTLSVDQVLFKEPIMVGELVMFYASVNYVGRSSMEIGIKVIAEDLISRHSRHTNTSYFTMVAVDEHGKPVTVPPLTLRNQLEEYRFNEAKLRKESRMQVQKTHRSHKQQVRNIPE